MQPIQRLPDLKNETKPEPVLVNEAQQPDAGSILGKDWDIES